MTKADRLYALKALLEHRGCVPMHHIMQRLEVSRATVKRDIEFLRDRMGVPVVWDAFNRGYSIEARSWRREDGARELPGLWFTRQEIAALLRMHELVARLDENGRFREDLAPLQQRLQRMLGSSHSELEQVLDRVRKSVRAGSKEGEPWQACRSAALG